MSPDEFYAHTMRAADAEGRLPLSDMTGWETFPFEPSSLRAVPLAPPVLPEPGRHGEDGRDCSACTAGADVAGSAAAGSAAAGSAAAGSAAAGSAAAGSAAAGRAVVWSDEHWRLSVLGASGTPLLLFLEPHAHYDLPGLPDDLAGELGLLVVRITRAIESLPHIARAHVSRWGDGGAHLHVFFFARPAGFAQLRGTCLAIWDDLLPAVPAAERDRDAAAVAQALADSHGGRKV
jgi:hypothetical protein